jgi:hypothetical protein
MFLETEIDKKNAEIKRLKDLLSRAAAALEGKPVYDAVANYHLIQKLRDAAK